MGSASLFAASRTPALLPGEAATLAISIFLEWRTARCCSPHAQITRIDVTRARAAPGVICVLKAVDYDALRGKSVISSPAIVEPVAAFHGPDHDSEPRFTDYDEGRL